jgi:hypothetical protein
MYLKSKFIISSGSIETEFLIGLAIFIFSGCRLGALNFKQIFCVMIVFPVALRLNR